MRMLVIVDSVSIPLVERNPHEVDGLVVRGSPMPQVPSDRE